MFSILILLCTAPGAVHYAQTFYLWRLCEAPITIVPGGNDVPPISKQSSSVINHYPSFCLHFCNNPNHQKPSLVPGLRKLLLLPLGWSLRPYGFVKTWTTRCRQKTKHIRRSQRRHYRHREPRHQERGRESGSSASFLKSVRSVIFCSRRKSPS
jgi:hypothetical protein